MCSTRCSIGKIEEPILSPDDQYANIYSNHIQNLSFLLEEVSDRNLQMKRICCLIQDMELNHPSVTKLGTMSTIMAQALSSAKSADDVFGPNSQEANAAWDIAEMASSDHGEQTGGMKGSTTHRYKEAAVSSHHNYMTVVDLTTLHNAIDAFGKIDHLHRLIKMESKRIDKVKGDEKMP